MDNDYHVWDGHRIPVEVEIELYRRMGKIAIYMERMGIDPGDREYYDKLRNPIFSGAASFLESTIDLGIEDGAETIFVDDSNILSKSAAEDRERAMIGKILEHIREHGLFCESDCERFG